MERELFRASVAWWAVAVLLVAVIGAWGMRVWDASSQPTAEVRQPLRLDLNHADRAALQLLPRVGATLADNVLREREARGPFASVDGLLRVRGIGAKNLRAIRQYVCVREMAEPPRAE